MTDAEARAYVAETIRSQAPHVAVVSGIGSDRSGELADAMVILIDKFIDLYLTALFNEHGQKGQPS